MNTAEREALLRTLADRFAANMHRHRDSDWASVEARLGGNPDKLQALAEMEQSGGEPDVIGCDAATGTFIFCDCSAESPAGRRSLCYDEQARASRKANKPAGSASAMAAAMGIEMLTEQQYRELQALEAFDRKTSSWVRTPVKIRELGGALFCDHRFDTVFVYHNGAESYYAARGFRGRLAV